MSRTTTTPFDRVARAPAGAESPGDPGAPSYKDVVTVSESAPDDSCESVRGHGNAASEILYVARLEARAEGCATIDVFQLDPERLRVHASPPGRFSTMRVFELGDPTTAV